MYKNDDDIILIKDTHLEYIDKIIVILNDNKKHLIPKDIIIKQAENIIYEYQKKGYNRQKAPFKSIKIFLLLSSCFMISFVFYLALKLLI